MKLTTVFLLAICLQVSAAGYAQRISISGQNMSLKSVFREIQKQTGFTFFYSDNDLQRARNVTIDAHNAELLQVLNQVFQEQPLSYTIVEKTVVVKEKAEDPIAVQQTIDIRGRVVNESGEGIAGVTVSEKGTKNATATTNNGEFALQNVDERATLVFSGVNVENREISVNGRSNLSTITLKTKITSTEEIVVTVNTGYQTLSKERSAGSFSKPDMEIVKDRSSSMNVLQRLDGLVPGLTINNAPGSEDILIRGLNSVNSTRAPLIVVDGIPISNVSSINPQDVADVTILKDATASSIWGSRASNGVIVITTKKGSSNDRVRVNYDGFLSFQGKPNLDYLPVMNSQQYIQAAREVFDPVTYPWNTASAYSLGAVGMPPHEMIVYNEMLGRISSAQASKSLDSLSAINNRDQMSDLWYRSASLMNHTVSVSGGGKVYSFYGSLAYTDLKSNQPGASDQTYKANLRQDFNFNKFIKVYLNADITNNLASSPRNVNVDSRFYPYQLFQAASGNNLSLPYVGGLTDSTRLAVQDRTRLNMDYFALDDARLAKTNTNFLTNRLVGGVTVNIVKGLRYEGVFGYNSGNNKITTYDDNTSFIQRNELAQFTVAATPFVTPVYYLPVAGGKYTIRNTTQRDWTARNQLAFDHSWKEGIHQLTMLAGYEAQEQLFNTNQTIQNGYSTLLLNAIPVDYAALALGVANPVVANNINKSVLQPDFYRETENQTRFTSYYANAAYTYARKYSVNGSWRVDKSNLFGLEEAAQNKPVWSAGVKWMLSEESFLKEANFINNLGLRATYGITGNAPAPGTASSYNILASTTSASLPGGRSFSISTPGNPDLSWERTEIFNLGLDFDLLKNRLSGSIDYYQKKTENLIGQLPVNTLTGYSVIVGNYGDLKNKGFELNLQSLNIDGRNFRWTTQLNLAYNSNIITNLRYTIPITTGQQSIGQRFLPGYPAFALFAYQYAGLDELGDPLIYLADKSITKARNIAKPHDMLFMGTTQPPWSGGLSNIFHYKGFALTINTIFNLGHVMRRDVGSYFSGRLIGGNALVMNAGRYNGTVNLNQGNIYSLFAERWRSPGDESITSVPSYVSSSSISNSRRDVNYYIYGDLNVLDASYMKIRDITLSYSLPKDITKRLKTNNITFRAQVSNLMLWKANEYGIDPEFQGFDISSAFGGNPETVSGVNRSLRNNQGAITIGAHISL